MMPKKGEVLFLIANSEIFPETPISIEELNRGMQMESVSRREVFFAGRRLVRHSLSQWLSLDPLEIMIRFSQEGAPYVQGLDMPFFSISHSGDMVVVAFSMDRVGADLEHERPLDMLSLADRFFSAEEASLIRKEKDLRIFFRLWTCREASIKADGGGMGKLLASSKVVLKESGWANAEIDGNTWKVHYAMVDRYFHAAVASREFPSLIHWCDLR